MKLKYHTHPDGCHSVTIDADQNQAVEVTEVFRTPQLVNISTDTGTVELSQAEVDFLVPILQCWLDRGFLPNGKENE